MKKTFSLSPKHIHLMALIKQNMTRPSIDFLAKEMRMHENSIRYYLKILKKEGFLDKNETPTEKSRGSI